MRYVQADGVVTRKVAGELVLVPTAPDKDNPSIGGFFVLNETGEALWQCLEQQSTEEELAQHLMENFEVRPDVARADVNAVLRDMRRYGVIRSSED